MLASISLSYFSVATHKVNIYLGQLLLLTVVPYIVFMVLALTILRLASLVQLRQS
jgi:hypothetical protein